MTMLDSPAPEREATGPPVGPATTVPDRSTPPNPQRRRKFRSYGTGAADVAGAAVASICMTLLLFGRITALSGLIGFVIVAYAIFITLYLFLVSLHEDRQAITD